MNLAPEAEAVVRDSDTLVAGHRARHVRDHEASWGVWLTQGISRLHSVQQLKTFSRRKCQHIMGEGGVVTLEKSMFFKHFLLFYWCVIYRRLQIFERIPKHPPAPYVMPLSH